jgi:ankyrin repeat protein
MLQLIIDACPDAPRRASSNGLTPLHILCSDDETLLDDDVAVDILDSILDKCPEAARCASNNGYLPIQVAAGRRSKSLEFCRMLIEAYPGSERIADTIGTLPFNIAFLKGAIVTAKYLYQLYPECINLADEDGRYPIHRAIVAVTREAPTNALEMVQMLLDCDPDVASQKLDGSFPLCLVCFASMSFGGDDAIATSKLNAALKIAQALYDAYPEAIEEDNLSFLIRSGLFREEIQNFIDAHRTYALQASDSTLMSTRDENGQLPLHRALQDDVTLGSIKLLVKVNRDAVRIPNNDGAMPLHVAVQCHNSTKVVDYLVGLDSDTLTAVDGGGNTALHLACRGAKYDTITLLLEKYNAVSVSKTNTNNMLPIHLLLESNAVTDREEDIKYTESIFRLLRAYPDTVII